MSDGGAGRVAFRKYRAKTPPRSGHATHEPRRAGLAPRARAAAQRAQKNASSGAGGALRP